MNLLPRLSLRPRARLRVALCVAVFCCVVLTSGAALAQTKTWHRIGTVTTQTAGQFCYTNGSDMVCDSNAPTLFGTNVGIGSTLPVVSLDDSQNPDAIALPGGSNAQRPTGAALVNGEIRYNTSGTGQVEAYYNGAWNSLVTSATAGTSTPAAGSTGYVQFNSGGDLAASSNLFWNNSSGYLGIGTTSPLGYLTVGSGNTALTLSSSDASSGAWIRNDGSNMVVSTGLGSLFLGYHGNSGKTIHIGNGNPGVVEVVGSAPGGSLVVASSGNVGIGTTNPPSLLSVGASSKFTVDSSGNLTGNSAVIGQLAVLPIVVSGITSPTAVNGTYTFKGTYNGKNYYQQGSNSYYIWFGGSSWEITSILGSQTGGQCYTYQTINVPLFAPWDGCNIGFNGSAVTVNAAASNATVDSSGNITTGGTLTAVSSAYLATSGGNVGIGTTNPTSDVKADINGAAQIAGTGSEVCATMADVGKMRFNPSKNYFEICSP